jgi:hypothetical protein
VQLAARGGDVGNVCFDKGLRAFSRLNKFFILALVLRGGLMVEYAVMKSGGSIFIVLLWIVSNAAAQVPPPATQPGKDRNWLVYPEVDLTFKPRIVPETLEAAPPLPKEPTGEPVPVSDVLAALIQARSDIRTIKYSLEYVYDLTEHMPKVLYEPELRVTTREFERKRGLWSFEGTRTCFLVIRHERLYEGRASNPVDIPFPFTLFFQSPSDIVLFSAPSDNPQRIFLPAHPRFQESANAHRMGQPEFDLLNRWGWGFRTQNLPDRDIVTMDYLKWYRVEETDSERIFDVWNYRNGNKLRSSRVHLDKRSGLVSRHLAFGPDGSLIRESLCEFAEVSDSADPSRKHWAPVAIHESSWRNGKLARNFSARVREMQINVEFDCEAARERLFAFFPPKADLFESHTDGKVRVMLLSDGKWIDQNIPELSPGATFVDPSTLPPAPPGWNADETKTDSGVVPPSNDGKTSLLTWFLIASGAILIALASWAITHSSGRSPK